MRKEYDLKRLKVKRRGLIPGIETKEGSSNKIRITISLDQDIVDYFKSEAKHPGAFPYQTQINQALRKLVDKWGEVEHSDIEELKAELLSDTKFIRKLAKQVDQKFAQKQH
jgi:uncharacterized protein (DUF4415 family)